MSKSKCRINLNGIKVKRLSSHALVRAIGHRRSMTRRTGRIGGLLRSTL